MQDTHHLVHPDLVPMLDVWPTLILDPESRSAMRKRAIAAT